MTYPENMLVEILVSDPWDWCTVIGGGPFDAKILKWKIDKGGQAVEMLLSLLIPRTYKGVECAYFVGSPRHEEDRLEDILRGRELPCDLVCIPKDRANSTDPFDLSWWRGGIGLICTVRRSKKGQATT
jgi:hypothetical protein